MTLVRSLDNPADGARWFGARSQGGFMATNESEPTVSRQTLAETPLRALQFLRGVGTNDAIRAVMFGLGYRAKDHKEGWELLHACSGSELAGAQQLESNEVVASAIAELDRTDERLFRIIRATLERRHPNLVGAVFDGLSPGQGAEAVLSIGKLLDRLAALEKTEEGKAALKTLELRGVTPEERARLAQLVKKAQSAQPVPKVDTEAERRREDERQGALMKLRAWYVEWSEIARASIRRRDHLITLGLARRKTGEKDADERSLRQRKRLNERTRVGELQRGAVT